MNPRLNFIKLLSGYKITQCLYVAAKLNIADHLLSSPKTANELALLVNVKPGPLYRVLRCLAALDVFNEDENKMFSLNETAELLLSESMDTFKDYVILCGDDLYKTTSELLYSVETGLPAFDHIHGMNFWEHLNNNPANAAKFHDAMSKGTELIINELISHYDFSPYKKIIDVGGGKGHIICGILSAYPNATGTVFDLSSIKDLALEYINEKNLSDRCEVIIGDFFDSVPTGGDIYLLKVVLHDWDDEQSITILKNCRKVMSRQSKLLIIERIVENDQFKDLACLGDINMLVNVTGKERSVEEFNHLLKSADLHFKRIIHTNNSFSIIEASPIF